MVKLHTQKKRVSNIYSEKIYPEWGKAKPGAGNGPMVIPQVGSAALNVEEGQGKK